MRDLWLCQLMLFSVVSQQKYCFFGDNSWSHELNKDPQPYFGTFVETAPSFAIDSVFVNGAKIYSRAPMYDTETLWMIKHSGLNTWILSKYEPSLPPPDIIATCICVNPSNCDLINCDQWYWGEQWSAVSSELLPTVKIQNRICEECQSDDDCNAFRAEICHDIPPKTCVHVGWIKFMDHQIYVLETDGVIGVPVQRYGFPKHIKLSATATWKVIKGTTDPDHKEAVYFYHLPIDKQDIAKKVPKYMVGAPHYDFTTENPNNTKHWTDGQLTYIDIYVEINDDGVYEAEFEEFQIEIFPEENVFLKTNDIHKMSVIIIGPNGGERGVIQFAETQFEAYEEDNTVSIPVQRTNGNDGAVSVEYSVINDKLPESATFGRDYEEFGIWERLLHHECDYLKPLESSLPVIKNFISTQRYFDIIANSGFDPVNETKFSSNEFLSKFSTSSKVHYQYPKEWSKGFGCCSTTTTPRTYPDIYDYEWLQFRLEWPLDDNLDDQIWAQMQLPIYYNSTTVNNIHPADISFRKLRYNNKEYGPDITPKYTRAWKGLIACDATEDCVFRTAPVGFEIGQKALETNLWSLAYKPEYCLVGPFVDASFAETNAASLYIKNFKTAGRLHWAHGDSSTKTITIQLINDDEYEPTEQFTVKLSVTPHPNPEYNPLINPNANTATVYIMGPNDVNVGTIGFPSDVLYTNEGELFCIPLLRSDGSDETAYVQYNCQGQTAQHGKDFEWRYSAFGEYMWPSGNNDIKCINIYVFKDEIYEDDEDILCEITMIWSDYADLKPQEGYMQTAVIIKSNDDQMKLDTPWIIAKEGNTAKMRISRLGFKGKHVSVKYRTAACMNVNQCNCEEFAIGNIDYKETIGELWFFANESLSNKTIAITIIDDGEREETEAFMFFIEKGEIITPNDALNPYKNASYTYNIYQSTAIIWIHGPNNIPRTEFALLNDSIIYLNEPSGNVSMELYSIYVSRIQQQDVYDFECSVKIHCDSYTASADRDFVCNDTTLYWAKNEHDTKKFTLGLYNDEHWEHEEIFYIALSDPVNGILRNEHKHITIAIIANDKQNCTGSIVWSEWTNCSISVGTGVQTRYKTSIQQDKQTGKIECVQISESQYCQMIDYSAVQISMSSSTITLYEGDYQRDHQVVTYKLGGTPNFYDDKYIKQQDDADDSLDGCVVKLILLFDDNLDVSASPAFLCWSNTTWAEEKNVTITIEDNDRIDPEDPRKRLIEVSELMSVDPLYAALSKEPLTIEVLVFDDEYCDESMKCNRGKLTTVHNEMEYEDEIQDIETDEVEMAVVLVIFFCVFVCLIGSIIKNRNKTNAQKTNLIIEPEEQKQALDQEMKEMQEIEKMEQYLQRQHKHRMEKKERELKKDGRETETSETESLLFNNQNA